jgi:protein subunit release factor B
MTESLVRLEANCETGVVSEVPLTAEDIAQLEELRVVHAAKIAAEEEQKDAIEAAKASAAEKLAALGLTAEEIAALSK